jgi:aryl-alcohol dehydrogenase-like predicted oxidoreductase
MDFSQDAEELAECVKEGLIQTVGVTNADFFQLLLLREELTSRGVPLTTHRMPFSLLCNSEMAKAVLEECKCSGVTMFASNPLGEGWLTGKYSEDQLPKGWDKYKRYQSRPLQSNFSQGQI